jgi:hypothetical protein
MNRFGLLRRPSAFLPVTMSLAALVVVLFVLWVHGPAPQADEGAAAHAWQLLMAGQLPIAFAFAIRWIPREPRPALAILTLQAAAALAAMAPIYLLHW